MNNDNIIMADQFGESYIEHIVMVDQFAASFMDLETYLNAADTVRIGYIVFKMFAECADGDMFIGSINPKYADAFITEFKRVNDCQVWFNTMTYWL